MSGVSGGGREGGVFERVDGGMYVVGVREILFLGSGCLGGSRLGPE